VLNRTRAFDKRNGNRGSARVRLSRQKEAARVCGGRGPMEIECGTGGASREVSKSDEWQDCYFEDVASGKGVMVLGRRRRAA
jgi:hypothetical protein